MINLHVKQNEDNNFYGCILNLGLDANNDAQGNVSTFTNSY